MLFSTGCKDRKLSFWPSSVPESLDPGVEEVDEGAEVRLDTDAFTPSEAMLEAQRAVAAVDEPTGLPSEIGLGGEEPLDARAAPELPPINFGFDASDVSPELAEKLSIHAEYLKANPELRVVLRGHTDDQGTEEYNIALGARRAAAVRKVLVDLGVPAAHVTTVSFGEGLPLVPGETSAARAQNRRVEFFIYEEESAEP